MTCFPRHIYNNRKEIKMTNTEWELKEIPYSIRSGLMPKSIVTFEGLSTKLDVSRQKNSDLSNGLSIYNPIDEDDGLNFGVMFYKHDNFKDTYQVNPHKINFDKDRSTLCVGSTHYPADIGRFKKGTEEKNYTLKLNKNVRSPLFVPTTHKEIEFFLVLFPLDNEHDDPPLIIDEDSVDDNARKEPQKVVVNGVLLGDDPDQEDVVIEKPRLEEVVHTVQTKQEYMDDIDFDNKEKLAEFKTADFMKHKSWHKQKHREQKSKPYNDDEYNVVYEDKGLKMLFDTGDNTERNPVEDTVEEEYPPILDVNFS